MTTLTDQVTRFMDASMRMVAPDFTTFEGGLLTRVRCKRCGNDVQLFNPVGEPRLVPTDTGPQRIQPFSLTRTSLYAEVTIACSDGSKHVSAVCTECLPKLTLQDLEDFLTCDTQALLKEANESGVTVSSNLLDTLLPRRAIERIS